MSSLSIPPPGQAYAIAYRSSPSGRRVVLTVGLVELLESSPESILIRWLRPTPGPGLPPGSAVAGQTATMRRVDIFVTPQEVEFFAAQLGAWFGEGAGVPVQRPDFPKPGDQLQLMLEDGAP